MTADEVVNEIKALRPEERAKVLNLLLEITSTPEASPNDDTSFDRAAEDVLARHADLMRKLAQ